MAGTHFNKRRKLGSSDVISVFTTELQLSTSQFYSAAFCQVVEGLFRLNMAESDKYFRPRFIPFSVMFCCINF